MTPEPPRLHLSCALANYLRLDDRGDIHVVVQTFGEAVRELSAQGCVAPDPRRVVAPGAAVQHRVAPGDEVEPRGRGGQLGVADQKGVAHFVTGRRVGKHARDDNVPRGRLKRKRVHEGDGE